MQKGWDDYQEISFSRQAVKRLYTLTLTLTLLPIFLIAGFIYFVFIRNLKMAGKNALSFGKSKARMLAKDKNKTTFKDVAGVEEAKDEVYEQAKELVLTTGQASASLIQRRLRVGYPRAARMIEQMETEGLVGAAGRDGRREVLGRRGPVGATES